MPSQLIKLEGASPGSPHWFPDKEPTIPVAALDEVQLIASLAVGLYGATVLVDMRAESKLDIVRESLEGFTTFLGTGAAAMAERQSRGKKKPNTVKTPPAKKTRA